MARMLVLWRLNPTLTPIHPNLDFDTKLTPNGEEK